ncbi:MAG: hypothetical protein GQ570_06555 [Helicobacteraceae bacterium]|nr:hypothetical protein [Helicobacteraceae bacterium]
MQNSSHSQLKNTTEKICDMADEYDFSNAEQGKFYRPLEELDIPNYLEENDVDF